ncbi:PH domain-containing protein [Salisediminibacterium beveridgei]|uniref:YokE-like PH domain-containing protein n=1 Tax=Salisediminibacterium beveridgei TaxID=632773 RepID=A0A1D7QT78_9BACI|nr:PH domain-containing protein [Salisediminibacterium beveridgei]AOM82224.1 hypothetical protein BBEV_0853 [Salisediminibacterium beveridgei]
MQASMNDIRQHLDPDDEVIACIRCSIKIFIYNFNPRPGLLAATKQQLIFIGDRLPGETIKETFDYEDIEEFSRRRRLFTHILVLRHQHDITKFCRMTTGSVDLLIDTVQSRMS